MERKREEITASEAKEKNLNTGAIIACVMVMLVIAAAIVLSLLFVFKKPYDNACELYKSTEIFYEDILSEYSEKIRAVEAHNDELSAKAAELRHLIASDIPPYDESTLTLAEDLVNRLEQSKQDIPAAPEAVELIDPSEYEILQVGKLESKVYILLSATNNLKQRNENLSVSDCSSILAEAESAKINLSNSLTQARQVTNPSAEFVSERIADIPGVSNIAHATPEYDPNGKLGTSGGYTGEVFFVHINAYNFVQDNLDSVELGAKAGGALDIYATKEDALRRCEELDGYGTKYSLCGTVVIRISDAMTSAQRISISNMIINNLLRIE